MLNLALCLTGCAATPDAPTSATPGAGDVVPTPQLAHLVRERREIAFDSQGAQLAGELDLPLGAEPAPLVFIIHHSGPVTRDAYGYLAEILLAKGYAVFRFDKRGVGSSSGTYGCCESDDALAAYQSATQQPGIDRCNVFIVAQSIGTEHLADRFDAFAQTQQPRGVALLSNLLHADRIARIAAPIHVIIADSEPERDSIGLAAVAAHRAAQPFGASLYIAEGAEHTLFDVSTGPIDWSNPEWVHRYHRGAMDSLVRWLDDHRAAPSDCAPTDVK